MAKGGEKMGKQSGNFWIRIACFVLAVAAGVGLVPGWLGMASEVVVQQLDKIEVTPEYFAGYTADVVRIVDGDTIEVRIDTDQSRFEMLRLIGVDTPETKHPGMPVQFFGPEATQFVENMCSGKVVRLHMQKDGPSRGSYGRLLVYVELPSGAILNEEIIRNGFGYSYTKYPHEHAAKYSALQLEAKNSRRGLWASVKFEDLPEWLRESSPDVLK